MPAPTAHCTSSSSSSQLGHKPAYSSRCAAPQPPQPPHRLGLKHHTYQSMRRLFSLKLSSSPTHDHTAQLQAVSYHLCVPVLPNASLKPSYSCTTTAFTALPGIASYELIIVSGHAFTDVVLVHCPVHTRTPSHVPPLVPQSPALSFRQPLRFFSFPCMKIQAIFKVGDDC
jgi:hypothetical protein